MIREMLLRYRGRFATGCVLLLATNACGLLIPLVLKDAVEAFRLQPEMAVAGRFALLIAGVATLQALVRTASRLAVLGASRRIAFDLRNRFFAHLQRLPVSFYSRASTGDLMSRAVNDMMSVRSLFGPGAMNLANTVIVYVAALSIMTWISPLLTLAALVPLPLLVFSVQRASRRLYARSRQVQERLAEISDRVQENLSGIQMVKTYAQEDRETETFNVLSDSYRNDNLALARVRGVLLPLMGSMGGAGTLVAVWVGGNLVASGAITLGEFVAFSGYLGMLVWPTIAMGWVINTFQRGLVATRRLGEILASPAEDEGAPEAADEPAVRGDIEFRHLTLSHRDSGPPALSDFSLRVPCGQVVALVGGVGSGKSTVANILPRFVKVPDGTVFIDGRDINQIPLAALRRALGYAPQEAFLFSRTIRENIAYGDPDASPERIDTAARRAGLTRDLDRFPHGLDTRVGEGGFTLSGGQRQRSALARALLLSPRILIIDDALSSVDSETEQEILEGLDEVMGERTTILISHRIAAVSRAHRIVVVADGRTIESGTHGELMARNGTYAAMARQQALEHEIEVEP